MTGGKKKARNLRGRNISVRDLKEKPPFKGGTCPALGGQQRKAGGKEAKGPVGKGLSPEKGKGRRGKCEQGERANLQIHSGAG